MAERLIEKIRASGKLPSPIGAAMRVLDMSRDENVTLVQIADVISTDPALASRILRFANSPFSGVSREVGSIRHAVMMLGVRTVTMLSLGFSLVSDRTSECEGFDYNQFWHTSLGCATFSEGLARVKSQVAPDEAFTAGLLANIGQLAFASGFPREYAEVIRKTHGDAGALLHGEQNALGGTHMELGASLLEEWGLPLPMCEAVRSFRSTPDNVEEASALQAILYVADELCLRLLPCDELGAAELQESLRLVQQYHGVTVDEFMAFFERANQERLHLSEILSVPAMTARSPEEIQAQAEKLLSEPPAPSALGAEAITGASHSVGTREGISAGP
jgi:HD-like signal output (HDOD) protein